MNIVNETPKKSIKELAQEELKAEKVKAATKGLKKLYAQLSDAEKIVRNIQREIDDYVAELDS